MFEKSRSNDFGQGEQHHVDPLSSTSFFLEGSDTDGERNTRAVIPRTFIKQTVINDIDQ